jgi:hypothetical protein
MGGGCGGCEEVVIPLFQQLQARTVDGKENKTDPDLLFRLHEY